MAVTSAPVAERARAALTGRREVALLDDPSVVAAVRPLVERCREPAPWVRAAVGTLDRFRREVAAGDLPALLAAGQADPEVAPRSLEQLARRHDGLTPGQLSQLAFGPRLWWSAAGIQVPWRPLSAATSVRPVPGSGAGPDTRLLLLAVIGAGATESELLGARVRDAGRLDAHGALVPDLEADPFALTYRDARTGAEHLTFLSFEARTELLRQLQERGGPGPDEPLLLPEDRAAEAVAGTAASSAALIGAGNDVNVTLCRATGDFFRVWGMPGARFDARASAAEVRADAPPDDTSDPVLPDPVLPEEHP